MSKKNETIQRPIPLQPGESASVVSPIYPSVVYASETPDMLDDQYEGRIQGYTYAREGHPNAVVFTATHMLGKAIPMQQPLRNR